MKKTKLEKGITLVALIITIVVLLILAVVSIGAVKNSGIIGHAQNTTKRWKESKIDEEEKIADYENMLKEWKVYGTEESYVIISSDNDVFVYDANDEGLMVNKKIPKMSKEELISLEVEQQGTAEDKAEIKKNAEKMIEDFENNVGGKVDYIIWEIDLVGLISVGDKLYTDFDDTSEYFELNTELAKKVIKRKGTFECYGITGYKPESSNLSDAFSLIDENNIYMCLGTTEGKGAVRLSGKIISKTDNEEDFDVNVEGNQFTIKQGSKKILRRGVDLNGNIVEEDLGCFYIQDSKLYRDNNLGTLEPGENTNVVPKLEIDQIDFAKFGILVS